MRRQWLSLSFVLGPLLGCSSSTAPTIDMPANAIVYQMDPRYLAFDYVDSTGAQLFELVWLAPSQVTPWIGYNCLGFVPRSSQDTTGTFVFRFAGPNTGRVRRQQAGFTDTTVAYFLPPVDQGTHGDYVVESNGLLHLAWADGTQSRYFDPSATLRFSGDTLWSDADLRSNGDSIRVRWRVAWIQQESCAP